MSQTKGFVGFVFAMNMVCFLPILYCQLLLVADMDSYKNLFFAGVPNSMALCVLIWIYCFSMQFSEEEAKLAAAMVIQQAAKAAGAGTDDPPPGLEESSVNEAVVEQEESEF